MECPVVQKKQKRCCRSAETAWTAELMKKEKEKSLEKETQMVMQMVKVERTTNIPAEKHNYQYFAFEVLQVSEQQQKYHLQKVQMALNEKWWKTKKRLLS